MYVSVDNACLVCYSGPIVQGAIAMPVPTLGEIEEHAARVKALREKSLEERIAQAIRIAARDKAEARARAERDVERLRQWSIRGK